MKIIKYYSHEIYTVITILLILFSALFVRPDMTQQLALVYAFIFMLHEWEENFYPGGFFELLFGKIARIRPVPSGAKLRESRTYVYILLITLTFVPYFLHTHAWLILPIVYLGCIEGLSHSIIMPYLAELDTHFTPGIVTALCQFCLSIFTLYLFISRHYAAPWQYIISIFILIAGLAFMALNGMRTNGIDPREMPRNVKRNLRERKYH